MFLTLALIDLHLKVTVLEGQVGVTRRFSSYWAKALRRDQQYVLIVT